MRSTKTIVSNLVSTLIVSGCLLWQSTNYGAEARTAAVQPGHTFSGYSHHYADRFHGRRTASGQAHDKFKLTAAHRTLPFGTHIQVTNKRNGKSCVVVVNDRGPFGSSPGLCLDVSKAAAHKLGFPGGGKIPIVCEVIDPKVGALALKNHDAIAMNDAAPKPGANAPEAGDSSAESLKKNNDKHETFIAELKRTESNRLEAKAQSAKTTLALSSKQNSAPHIMASKPVEHQSAAHQPVDPTANATKQTAHNGSTPGDNTTFLLVINEAIEAQPTTANYTQPAANTRNALAPTVFLKMDGAQKQQPNSNHTGEHPGGPSVARDSHNILL